VDTEAEVLNLILGLFCVLFGLFMAFMRRDRYLPDTDRPSRGTTAGLLVLGLSLVIFSFAGWTWLIACMVLGGVLFAGSGVIGFVRDYNKGDRL